MKKIIITSVVITLTAVAVQAQSPRVETQIVRDCWMGAFSTPSTKNTTVASDSIQNAVTRAAAKSTAKAQSNQATQSTDKPSAKQDSQKAATINEDSGLGAWLKALFLGGPLPGESAESYRLRLEAQAYPASQPYK